MTRKPPSETPAQDASSRRARLAARRHRRIRVTVVTVLLAVAGIVAVGAYALKSNDPQAHAANTDSSNGSKFGRDGTLVPNDVTANLVAVRNLDHAHPLNLWIGGDSLAGSFGPALGDQVGATGVVKTVIDYKTSSGLWSNDIRNWYERATAQMASDNPEAVVFIIGTNDTPVVNNVDANGDHVPDWETAYRLKVDRMMDLLVGPNHRTVFWLGPPTLGTQSLDRGAKAIGELMRQEAAKRAPDVVYLDTYKLFSTPNGTFSRSINDENGKQILARISDGVHFTADGAAYLGRAVFSLLDARWRLTKQADLAHPIGWNFADGSGEVVPGYTSTPRSRYRSTPSNQYSTTTAPSISQTTTPPASTTPVTVAPTTAASTKPQTTATTRAPSSTVATTPPSPPTT